MAFSTEDLELIGDTGEVRIETREGDQVHRTVIWVVVDDGEVFVRSVRGEPGRWYQRALKDPNVALHVSGNRLEARAVPATDPQSVARTSDALRAKYPKSQSLNSMLRSEILETTLRLDPA
ncbi:MAG: nitroreductase/quinone reductase family protein [Acidimicrobiia bacterium]